MRNPNKSDRPIFDLVEESFDEAAFLLQRWEQDCSSHTRNLDEVWSWTEDRLHGALEGVLLDGDSLGPICSRELCGDDYFRVAVASGLLASSTDRNHLEILTDALRSAEGRTLDAMIRGLELLGSSGSLIAGTSVLSRIGPYHAGALCRLRAFHRLPLGIEANLALESPDSYAQAEVLRSIVHENSTRFDERAATLLESSDAIVQGAAVESGILRGSPHAWESARQLASSQDARACTSLRLLALLGGKAEHELVFSAITSPELARHAVWALGHIGTIRAIETCLDGMQQEHLARAFAEAYCWITGADLERDGIARTEEYSSAPRFEDDDLDADLVPTPAELWPLPDPELSQAHWADRRGNYVDDTRYIRGRVATTDAMMEMIETGPMLRRPDLILELRSRHRGQYDVEPRAFTLRQRSMMMSSRARLAGHSRRT